MQPVSFGGRTANYLLYMQLKEESEKKKLQEQQNRQKLALKPARYASISYPSLNPLRTQYPNP